MMPILKVYGFPGRMDDALSPEAHRRVLLELCSALQQRCASLPQLKIKPNQVTVFFPTDQLQAGLGEEIIVEVSGLFEQPERDEIVRQALARLIAETIETKLSWRLPQLAMIEVFIQSFSPTSGFARWERPEASTRAGG